MKFTVQPINLSTAFKAVKSVLGAKTSMPVLDNVLLQPADDQYVTLTASDGDNTIVVALEVENQENVRPILMPSQYLSSFVGQMGTFPVDVEVGDDAEVLMQDFMGEFRFMGSFGVKEYPKMPSLSDDSQHFDIPSADLLEKTIVAEKFVADDNLRPVMTGVCYDFQEDGLHVAASDSKILFTDVIPEVTTPEQVTVVINPRVVNAVKTAFVPSADAPIHLSFDQKTVRFSQGKTELIGRLIDGRYPRYSAVIPTRNDKFVEVDRAQLAAAMKRVQIAINSQTPLVIITPDGDSHMTVRAADIDFSLSAKVVIATKQQYDIPENFNIGVRCSFFRELIDSFPKNVTSIFLKLSDPTRAMLVLPEKDSKRISLIMPMVIPAELK